MANIINDPSLTVEEANAILEALDYRIGAHVGAVGKDKPPPPLLLSAFEKIKRGAQGLANENPFALPLGCVAFESMTQLKHGDVVVHRAGSKGYTVVGLYGGRATAVRAVDITNPIEWSRWRP